MALLDAAQGRFRAANPHSLTTGDRAMLFVRPERVEIAQNGAQQQNAMSARFLRRDLEGPFSNLHVTCEGVEFSIHQTNVRTTDYAPDETLTIHFAPEAAVVMAEGTLSDD
ncbi:TOBE domain-containing protein [Roseovarius sp. M141]